MFILSYIFLQSSWLSNDNPNGNLVKVCYVNVYTSMRLVLGNAFRRECLVGNCAKVWWFRRFTFDILQFNSMWPWIGLWEYGEQVMTSRETFTGFFKVMNARYNWSTSPGKFLLPGAFIKWWSGWTSLREINFWEICEMCDVKIDYLACDGTKIGMWGSWKGIFDASWNANK